MKLQNEKFILKYYYNKNKKMSINDFIIRKLIGKGAFGSVSLVTRKTDGKIYAMKRVNMGKLTNKEKESSLNEIRILASLSHPNIIGYKEAFFDQYTNTLNIVMEFAEEGDLEKKIKNNLKKRLYFEENTIWKWIIQLLLGIKYLHDNRIMHRDLKCANIFLMKNGLLKLGDLNVSKFAKYGLANTQTGTPYYCSPEIWKEKSYDYKSDIWSLGCIIYEICTLKPPFRGTSLKGLRNNVLNGHYLPIPSIYSNDLSILISKMLVLDPNKRCSANELLKDEIVVKRMKNNNSIFNSDIKRNINQEKANLIKTIRLPLNIKEINSKLPKKRYNPEEEMMKNDEYETMKETFFKNLKENDKNKNNNKNKNKDKDKDIKKKRPLSSDKSKNKYIENYNRRKNKEINKYENNKSEKVEKVEKVEKENINIKNKQMDKIDNKINKNNVNHSNESKKNGNYIFNRILSSQYEQALKNNYKLRKFYTRKSNNEEKKTINNEKYNEYMEKFKVKKNNYIEENKINQNKNKNININKSENDNILINNINNQNYVKINKDFPSNPYNLILNNNNQNINIKNSDIQKKNRYKNLFNDEYENNQNKNYSEIKKHFNVPQSALERQNKININFKEYNENKINKQKKRPITSFPSDYHLKKVDKPKTNNQKKNIVKVSNLYDKYKNKNKEKQNQNLYGFKYVPQKRQVYKIIYSKVNYNDYCKKNNIDKNKNYQYYRENGYYNYRNAMKKYANIVQKKNNKKNNLNQYEKRFNNYLKNEYKGGGGAGYAAKIRMQKYNK